VLLEMKDEKKWQGEQECSMLSHFYPLENTSILQVCSNTQRERERERKKEREFKGATYTQLIG
jgi:hypothetical protein